MASIVVDDALRLADRLVLFQTKPQTVLELSQLLSDHRQG